MNRRVLAVIMSFAVVFSMCCSFTLAYESDRAEEVGVVRVDTARDMDRVSESVDVVVLDDAEIYEEIDSGVIEENLDNGTVIVVDNIGDEQTEEVCDIFDIDLEEENLQENEAIKAVYVKADGSGKYSAMPVIASIEPLEDVEADEAELEEALAEAVEQDNLDLDGLYEDIDKGKDISELVVQVPEEDVARMQSSSLTASAFLDEQRKFVLYGWNGSAGYVGDTEDDSKSSKGDKGDDYDKDDQPSHWVKASTTTVSVIATKVKTKDDTTYDLITAKAKVDPTSTFRVKQYNFKLTSGDSDRYSVPEWSELKSGEKACTISISTDKSVDFSYTWDPQGQNIDTETGERGFWWRCKPSSPKADKAYYVEPYIVLKAKQGTTKTNYAYATLSYQSLKSLKYGGCISDRDRKITLKFKNHKES